MATEIARNRTSAKTSRQYLTTAMKEWIIDYLALGARAKEIAKEFEATFGDDFPAGLKISKIRYYRKHYCHTFEDRRARINERVEAQVPIASKVYRLKKLQHILDEALEWYIKTITRDGQVIEARELPTALKALEQARNEMEPRKIALTDPSGDLPLQATDDESTINELLSSVAEMLGSTADDKRISSKAEKTNADVMASASKK